MAVNVLGSHDHMPDLRYLPDLVIDKILQLVPTKVAVQVSFLSKQYSKGVVSLGQVLNFIEDDDFDRSNLNVYFDYLLQHIRFINFLQGYLEYSDKYPQKELLSKLRLHMAMYFCEDATTIDRWLDLAFHRGVKELDIRFKMRDPRKYGLESVDTYVDYCFYHLPWVIFANAKYLTTLNLECVTITDIGRAYIQSEELLLPSLKTMSCTEVWFNDKALLSFLWECPSIEYLSLTGCFFEKFKCQVSSLNLKSIKVKYCAVQVLQVDNAKNLESFTFVSLPPPNSICEKVILNNSPNLKNIHICVDELQQFSLRDCHCEVEATINTQNLHLLDFKGYLKANVSVKACQWAIIGVWEVIWDKKWFLSQSTHFPALVGFLKEFGGCKAISLLNKDFKSLIIPEDIRKAFSSPFPKSSILEVIMPNPPKKASRNYLDLMDSLHWIAPSAETTIVTPPWIYKYVKKNESTQGCLHR